MFYAVNGVCSVCIECVDVRTCPLADRFLAVTGKQNYDQLQQIVYATGREWGSVWLGVQECVAESGGVCGLEWGSVLMGVGKCVAGSAGVCGRE